MKWLVGFVLGLVGGFAVGYLTVPAAGMGRRCLPRQQAAPADAPRASAAVPGLAFDEQLTRTIREQLLACDLAAWVDVTTVDGVVYLRGRPRDADAAARIAAIAQQTPGVRSVVNELKPVADVPAG